MKNWSKESWGIFILGAALFLFGTGNYWSATWLSKWAFLITAGALFAAFWSAKRTSFMYLPLFLYVTGSLCLLGVWPQGPYNETLDQVTVLAIQKNALFGLAEVSALMVLFACVKRSMGEGIEALATLIWVAGVGATLLQPLHGPHSAPNNGLWFGNPSMGASLLAILAPFVPIVCFRISAMRPRAYRVTGGIVWLLTFAAIYKTKASVPWGVLGVVTAASLLCPVLKRSSWLNFLKTGLALSALAVGMVALGMWSLGHDFWDQNGRFEIWSMGYHWFKLHAHHSVGFGYSTPQILLPLEQVVTNHFHGDYFLWFHNDWLQLFVEGGWIGVLCLIPALMRIAGVSFRASALFAQLMGFVTLMLFNYPLRMPIHCLCLVLIAGLSESFTRRD